VDGRTCWRPPPLPSAALPSTPVTLLRRRPPPALSPPLLCRLPAPTSPPSSVSRAVAADPAAAPSRSLPRAPPPTPHPALARLALGGAASAPPSPMVPRLSPLAPPHPCPTPASPLPAPAAMLRRPHPQSPGPQRRRIGGLQPRRAPPRFARGVMVDLQHLGHYLPFSSRRSPWRAAEPELPSRSVVDLIHPVAAGRLAMINYGSDAGARSVLA